MNKLIWSLLALLLLSPITYAQSNQLEIISDFPDDIYGGTTAIATYQIVCDTENQHSFLFLTTFQKNITPNLSEFENYDIYVDDIKLNCSETIFQKGFELNCPYDMTLGVHIITIYLTFSPHIAPDFLEYSFTASYQSEEKISPVQPIVVPTSDEGSSYDPRPNVLVQKTVYLSHLENHTLDTPDEKEPEFPSGGGGVPWLNDFYNQINNLTNHELTEQKPYLNITYLDCTENPTHPDCIIPTNGLLTALRNLMFVLSSCIIIICIVLVISDRQWSWK